MRITLRRRPLPVAHERAARVLTVLLPWTAAERLEALALVCYVLWDERFQRWEESGE